MKNNIKLLFQNLFQSVFKDWNRNYKHQKGFKSLIKCIISTLRIVNKNRNKKIFNNKIEFLTFSVIPGLTSFWISHISSLKNIKIASTTIGDCSGGLNIENNKKINVIPILNFEHGYKIDLFIKYICKSEFIVICDDDIFFVDEEPLEWAKEEFRKKPNLVAVSLFPRPSSNKRVNNYIKLFKDHSSKLVILEKLMGSYCLIIRKKIWVKENISFQIKKPKNWEKVGNYFDTADFANLKLIELGYEIVIAPQKIQKKLICFTSMSLWGLRIQETLGNISKVIRPRPNEYEKAYRTAVALLSFNKYLNCSNSLNTTVKEDYIMRTIKICKSKINDKTRKEIDEEVINKFIKLV